MDRSRRDLMLSSTAPSQGVLQSNSRARQSLEAYIHFNVIEKYNNIKNNIYNILYYL